MSDQNHPVITRDVPTMYFFGVTTGKSSSLRMFPLWANILGQPDAQLLGVDIPIDAPREEYRRAVNQIKVDPLSLGALVTTHKINIVRAAEDLFDHMTDDARLCGEVSCLYKREGKLIGHSVDPVTSGLALHEFIPQGYWQTRNGEVLCLGSGGAAVAIVTHFASHTPPDDRPQRITLVDVRQDRLDHLRAIVENRLPDSGITFAFVLDDDPAENDRRMAALPAGSLVINATGMGKDIPGSPITDAATFPLDGIVWELNYRGDLDFYHQAKAQAADRSLTVKDGWTYFLLGWSHVIRHVFDLTITPEVFARLGQAAAAIR